MPSIGHDLKITFRVDAPGRHYAYAWVNEGNGWTFRRFRVGYTAPRLSKHIGWFLLLTSLALLTAVIG